MTTGVGAGGGVELGDRVGTGVAVAGGVVAVGEGLGEGLTAVG